MSDARRERYAIIIVTDDGALRVTDDIRYAFTLSLFDAAMLIQRCRAAMLLRRHYAD